MKGAGQRGGEILSTGSRKEKAKRGERAGEIREEGGGDGGTDGGWGREKGWGEGGQRDIATIDGQSRDNQRTENGAWVAHQGRISNRTRHSPT